MMSYVWSVLREMRKKSKKIATYKGKLDATEREYEAAGMFIEAAAKQAGVVEYNKIDMGVPEDEPIQKGHIFTLDQMNKARTITIADFKSANLDSFQLDYINSLRKYIVELEEDRARVRKELREIRKAVDDMQRQLVVDQKKANK